MDEQQRGGAAEDEARAPIPRVEAALAAHRPAYNAYRSWDPALSRAEAAAAARRYEAGERGPLLGVPYSLKDLYGADGWPCYAGSERRLGPRFERAGSLVTKLREGGAVLMGKTHTVEFAFGGLGCGRPEQTPKNPWGAGDRLPGGSSAGAGVSLLEGSAELAVGTDTLGSIRIPASFTGKVGLKTTHGRWPTDGIVPLSPRLDTAGLIANSATEARRFFAALDPQPRHLDPPRSARGLRFTVPEPLLDAADMGVLQVFFGAIAALERDGAQRQGGPQPPVHVALELFEVGAVSAVELQAFLRQQLPEWEPALNPSVRMRMAGADQMTAGEYLRRCDQMRRLVQDSQDALRQCYLLSPTVAISPPKLTDVAAPERYAELNKLALRNTACVSLLGGCAVSLPIGLDKAGMPVGLQIAAPAGHEEPLLAVAEMVEATLGTPAQLLGSPPA